jgi:pimeloyl-ACP methyl ester carboxylesterase
MRRAIVAVAILCVGLAAARADDTTDASKPVAAIAPQTLSFHTARGQGILPLYVSADWTKPQPQIRRALIVFHGKLRNADVYNASGEAAIRAAGDAGKGTLLITPQFLSQVDVDQFKLPGSVLRWAPNAWMGGDDAANSPVSSFDAIDAVLSRLADRTLFPNLQTVIVAGHSGGGQVVQRYAVVGRAGDKLIAKGIHVRYVVANPSSYVYFSAERPALDAKQVFTFGLPVKTCKGHYDLWKFGVHEPPPYVGGASFAEMEAAYLRRDVVYLLGTEDVDPNHPALDKTCSAEDEGAFRFFRGKAYFAYLEMRHPELKQPGASQQLWLVPGVEHDGDRMFSSPCGLAALFGEGTCSTRTLSPVP